MRGVAADARAACNVIRLWVRCWGLRSTRNHRVRSQAGSKHFSVSYEAWIAADPIRGGLRVLITGPQGFERIVQLDADEQPAEITRRVRETLDE
jgi:hypothetical protein